MKMTKILGIFAIFALLMVSSAFAAVIDEVEIDGDSYDDGDVLGVELGDKLDIELDVKSNVTLNDITITAEIAGYEYADKNYDTYDRVSIDRLKAGVKKSYDLSLDVPTDMDEDDYELIIEVKTRDEGIIEIFSFEIDVDFYEDEKIIIQRVNFDPAQVVAGRALRTTVRLENYGEEDADDIYVKVAIPALGAGMYVTADVDEIESGDSETTEDLLLRIPACVEAGTYDVVVSAVYDNDHEEDEIVEKITILESDSCSANADSEVVDKTVVTPPQSQEIVAGAAGTSFPLMIRNAGTEDKTYMVTVSGVEGWGSAEVSKSASFVRAGNTEVVYVYVSADADVVGMKTFVVSVSDGSQDSDLPVQVRVLPAEDESNAKQWIYGIIIVLLVLIVILGLAIGFKKMNSGDEEEYY